MSASLQAKLKVPPASKRARPGRNFFHIAALSTGREISGAHCTGVARLFHLDFVFAALCRIPHRQVPLRRLNAPGGRARVPRTPCRGCDIQLGGEKGWTQLDRSRTSRRNLLLAALPAKDFALLAPHLKRWCWSRAWSCRSKATASIRSISRDGIISLLAVMRHGDAIETATITIGYEARLAPSPGSACAVPTRALSCR